MRKAYHIGTALLIGLPLITAFQNCGGDAVPSGKLDALSIANSCNWQGGKLDDGDSITAFAVSSVPQGANCVSETRNCTKGVLSGTFTQPSCTILAAGSGTAKTVLITNGNSWVVPADFNPLSNVILTVGGGARGEIGGDGGSSSGGFDNPCFEAYIGGTGGTGGYGGGSGAVSHSPNVALVPGSTVTVRVGNGSDTYICGATNNCGAITGASVLVGAKAGNNRNGGAAANSIGVTRTSGANGSPGVGGNAGTTGYLFSDFGGPPSGGAGGAGGTGAGGTVINASTFGAGGRGGQGGSGGVPQAFNSGDGTSCSNSVGDGGQTGANGGAGVIMITYVPTM